MALDFTARHMPSCLPATTDRDMDMRSSGNSTSSASGSKRPAPSAPPPIDSNAFTQYRDGNIGDNCSVNDGESPPSCKKPRYLSLHGGDSASETMAEPLPMMKRTTDNGQGDNADSSPPDDAGNHAAEAAASRLEAQIDDLTSDMGHWCLTDLKGWRRRRAAVAVTASARTGSGSTEDDEGVNDKNSKDVGAYLSPASPVKRAQNTGTRSSPAVPQSPSEKEFLRQRRREARRSMLRGIANSGTGRRKLEV